MSDKTIKGTDERIIEFVELEEDVALAGAEPNPLSEQQAGRVLGLGCLDE